MSSTFFARHDGDAAAAKDVKYDLTHRRAWRVVNGKFVHAAMYGRHEEPTAR